MIFKRLFSLFGIGLLILAFYFIFSIIKDAWPSLIAGPDLFHLKFFLLATLMLFFYWIWQVSLWKSILLTLGTELSLLNSSYLFFSNGLLAYIPGKIGNLVGMASIADNMNISKVNTVTVVLISQIYVLISGTAVIFLSALFIDEHYSISLPGYMLQLIGLSSIVGLVMISPYGLRFTQIVLKKIFSIEFPASLLNFKKSLIYIFLYGVGWIILVLVVFFLFKSFLSINIEITFPIIAATFISSYLSGLLVVIVPSGIGILEAGLVFFLQSIIPIEGIVFSLISFRILAITSIIILFIVTWSIKRLKKLS